MHGTGIVKGENCASFLHALFACGKTKDFVKPWGIHNVLEAQRSLKVVSYIDFFFLYLHLCHFFVSAIQNRDYETAT